MRRIILLLLCFSCVITSFSGCHAVKKESVSFQVPEQFDTEKTYEIVFWAKNDSDKDQRLTYAKAIEDFEKIYPNINVTIRAYTDYGQIYKDVITNISTGTTPNICITYPDHIATYLTGEDTVVPLDGLIGDEKYGLGGDEVKFDSPTKEEVTEQFLNECKIGGYTYAMPFMRSTEACYINKTFVEKLGYTVPDKLTWDFIWEVSGAALEKDSDGNYTVNGQDKLIPFIYKSTDNMMIQMLKQQQAGYSKSNGEIDIFNDTTKSILDTVAENAEKSSFSTFQRSGYPGNHFNAGRCIFAIDSTAGATWMGPYSPKSEISEEETVDFETVVRAIPQFDTENPQMISQGPSMCLFNKEDPGEVLASWLFMQYLLTDEVQIAYSKTEGYAPVTDKAVNSEEYKDYLSRAGENDNEYYYVKIEAVKVLLENTENTFVTPVFNGSTSLRNAAGQLIENVVKSVKRNETVDDAYYEKLFSDVTSLYKLDQIQTDPTVKTELGPLPTASAVLLISIGAVWVIIVSYVIISKVKTAKK